MLNFVQNSFLNVNVQLFIFAFKCKIIILHYLVRVPKSEGTRNQVFFIWTDFLFTNKSSHIIFI